jgi:arsenate reductase
MAEAGVDIRSQRSKHVDELKQVSFDYVITVCDSANEACPTFPAPVTRIHVNFDDPPRLAKTARTTEEALVHYRRVRDEIERFVRTLPESIG